MLTILGAVGTCSDWNTTAAPSAKERKIARETLDFGQPEAQQHAALAWREHHDQSASTGCIDLALALCHEHRPLFKLCCVMNAEWRPLATGNRSFALAFFRHLVFQHLNIQMFEMFFHLRLWCGGICKPALVTAEIQLPVQNLWLYVLTIFAAVLVIADSQLQGLTSKYSLNEFLDKPIS